MFKNEFGIKFSKKGKIPWINLNEFEMGDSQFIIDYLSQKLDKDLSKNLTPTQKATERAFLKMIEESLFW